MINRYTDDSDNPGWITSAGTGGVSTTVYTDQVSDDLSMSIISDEAGTRGELAIVTPRGDVAATITITTPNAVADGIDSWTRYTEYGHPITPQPTGTTGAAGNGYGWLGAKQRTTTTTGLLLMGARLYNPATGLFTSIDPIYGGNDTPYTYPNDPVNKQDTTGEWWETFKTGLAVASLFCSVCAAASAAIAVGSIALYAYKAYKSKGKKRKTALANLGMEALGLVPGAGRVAGRIKSALGSRAVRNTYGAAGKALRKKGTSQKQMKAKRKAGRKAMKKGYQTTSRYSGRWAKQWDYTSVGSSVGLYVHGKTRRR